MSEHPPPRPPTARATGRRRAWALTAGLAAAALAGTGTVAVVAAASTGSTASSADTASTTTSTTTSTDQGWSPSGATVTHGSGSGVATSGGT